MTNWIAVVVAAIVSMILGMIWYSPKVFGKPWMRLMGMTVKDMQAAQKKGMIMQYIIAFGAALVTAYMLSIFSGYAVGSGVYAGGLAATGAAVGFLTWIGFVATVTLGMSLWGGQKLELYLITNAYNMVSFVLMAMVLAVWM